MNSLEFKCPVKKCKGYVEAAVSYDEGNTEGPCNWCDTQVAFHYVIEIDDVRVVEDE